jgi:nucleolar protein 15
MEKAANRLIKRQTEKKRKLEEAGIEYDFGAVAYVGVACRHLNIFSL